MNTGPLSLVAGATPGSTEVAAVQRLRVVVTKIHMDGNYDTFGDEWYPYIGVNGRWRVWTSLGGWSKTLNYSVTLDLHHSDKIRISGCGFEADLMHDYMGDSTGHSWAEISDPNLTTGARESIEDDIFWQLAPTFGDENDAIGHLFVEHGSAARGSFIRVSDKGDYRLEYTISNA